MWSSSAFAQTLADRFEVSAKKQRAAVINLLEERVEERKKLFEAARRGLINQPKNDYHKSNTPDGQVLHNFSFRSAADRKDVSARYQKQVSETSRDLKDVKNETAWPCPAKSLQECEVGDFVWLRGEFRIVLKETDQSAWIEKADHEAPQCFYLIGADFSRYADDKAIDFIDAKNEVVFYVRDTRLKPDSLRVSSGVGQTLYELEMVAVDALARQLPAGVRILKVGAVPASESEKDLPTPGIWKK